MAFGQNNLFSLPVLDRTTEIYKANRATEIYKAVAPMTDSKSDSKSRNMSQTYRFDVSVCIGPFSSQEDVCKYSKKFCVLQMPEIKSLDWIIAPSLRLLLRWA